MAGRRHFNLLLVVGGAVLLGVGSLQGAREIAPYFATGIGEVQRFGAVVAGTYEPGASLFSKSLFFSDCLEVQRTLFAKAQPPNRRAAFDQQCYKAARVATIQMPTYAEAWLVLASSALALGDIDEFRAGLVASQRVAPDVHWLGEQRLALAAENADELNDSAWAAYRLDIAALFGSPGGAEVLATRYLANPNEQELILEIGETLPATLQKRFVDTVRNLKTRQGSQ